MTQLTLESWLNTVTIPHSLVIIDNDSPPDVTEWLLGLDVPVILLGENRYPGYATNRGWEQMPPQTTLLQRSDNDIRYLPGWCDRMLEAFEDPKVGQFGPIAAGDEPWTQMSTWPVGGNSVIRRSLYDQGLRYSELPWTEEPGEDSKFCRQVWAMGYERRFSSSPCIEYLDDGDWDYRVETHAVRGLEPKPKDRPQVS